MDLTDLRVRANQELADLGPPPANARERELWVEERRGAAPPAPADFSRTSGGLVLLPSAQQGR